MEAIGGAAASLLVVMRNLFDQYVQPENRLTHALAVALHEDRRLLKRFVRKFGGKGVPAGKLIVVEQRLPGAVEVSEPDSRGLPDMCIHDGEDWCLLIESKVAADLSNNQLRRHIKTLQNRGFGKVSLLAIDVISPAHALPAQCGFISWPDLYDWLKAASEKSIWARHAAQYFEVAEARWPEEGYLKEGTLTKFSGVPFDHGEPYNYQEARRLIKLAMPELRKNRRLISEIAMDPARLGRKAIKGLHSAAVWDYLSFKGAGSGAKVFTAYPHMTLAIEMEQLRAMVTVPNGIEVRFRRNLVGLGKEGFNEMLREVAKRLSRELRGASGAAPWAVVVQRRFLSQRSQGLVDARVEYDLRTAFPTPVGKGNKVKRQEQWLGATYDALGHKRSNLQFAVGATFPYRYCTATKSREILNYVAGAWVACKPMLDVMFKR